MKLETAFLSGFSKVTAVSKVTPPVDDTYMEDTLMQKQRSIPPLHLQFSQTPVTFPYPLASNINHQIAIRSYGTQPETNKLYNLLKHIDIGSSQLTLALLTVHLVLRKLNHQSFVLQVCNIR